MSILDSIEALVARFASEFNTVYSKLGGLSSLNTDAKTSLVDAANEILAIAEAGGGGGGGGAGINDTTPTTSTTYSGTKVEAISSALQTNIDGKQPAGSYAGAVHNHTASEITSGVLTTARLPVGTSGSDVAAGNHTHTANDVGAEPAITLGSSAQYYRGDKTFQTLNKAAVGLGSVDNTADADKPISTATQASLDNRVRHDTAAQGLNVTQRGNARTNIGAEASITAGTTSQYYRGDKTFVTLDKTAVGLASVDNTADVDKPISTLTASALSGKAASSHTHNASDINAGTLALARAHAGGYVRVIWNGTSSAWEFEGVAITARPGGRTDLGIIFVGGAEANRPSWGNQPGDFQLVTTP